MRAKKFQLELPNNQTIILHEEQLKAIDRYYQVNLIADFLEAKYPDWTEAKILLAADFIKTEIDKYSFEEIYDMNDAIAIFEHNYYPKHKDKEIEEIEYC